MKKGYKQIFQFVSLAMRNTLFTTCFFLIVTFVLSGWLFSMWYRGRLSFTKKSKAAAAERNLHRCQSRIHRGNFGFLNWIPFCSWESDPYVAELVRNSYPDILPYLRNRVFGADTAEREAAVFFLSEIVCHKSSLEMLLEGLPNNYVLGDAIIVPPEIITKVIGLEYTHPLPFNEPFRTRNFAAKEKAEYLRRWYASYRDSIVDTDYGVGLTMPDGTIRPLQRNGLYIDLVKQKQKKIGLSAFTIDSADSSSSEWYFAPKVAIHYGDNKTAASTAVNPSGTSVRFRELLAQRLREDPQFWPYYPIIVRRHEYIHILGYNDSDHRPHGRWADYAADGEPAIEKWFYHGEETTHEEYLQRGGYDFERAVELYDIPPSGRD